MLCASILSKARDSRADLAESLAFAADGKVASHIQMGKRENINTIFERMRAVNRPDRRQNHDGRLSGAISGSEAGFSIFQKPVSMRPRQRVPLGTPCLGCEGDALLTDANFDDMRPDEGVEAVPIHPEVERRMRIEQTQLSFLLEVRK